MGRERGFHDHARPPALTSSDSGSGDRPRDNARCGPFVGYPDAYGIRALNSRSAERPSSTWRAGQHSMVLWAPGVGTAQGLAVVRFGEYHNMQYGGRQRTTRCLWGGAGTAYRIRTGDLRLERAVSWASRRMRREGPWSRACHSEPGRGPPGMIPAAFQGWQSEGWALGLVCLEEYPNCIRHLRVAVLAKDQPVVRVRSEGLVLRAEPVCQSLAARFGHLAVQSPTDDEHGEIGETAAVHRHALQDLAACRPDSWGFLPRRCWIRRTSASVRSGRARCSFSGSVGHPS